MLGRGHPRTRRGTERVAEDRVARGQHHADGVATWERREHAVEASSEPRVGVVDRLEVQP
jgi:hypothetical protein